jgi:hypothetical protein
MLPPILQILYYVYAGFMAAGQHSLPPVSRSKHGDSFATILDCVTFRVFSKTHDVVQVAAGEK